MTGKQHAVLWLGILLIAVRLFTTDQWHSIWGTLSKGSPVSFDGGGGGSFGIGNLIPGIGPRIPTGVPGVGSIPVIPLSKTTGNTSSTVSTA